MDKTFQQLKTHVIDLCHVASSSSCEKVLTEFKEKYTTLKGLFLGQAEDLWECTRRERRMTFSHAREVWKRRTIRKEMKIMFTLCQLTSNALRTWMERIKMHVLYQLKCISFPMKMYIFYHFPSKELEKIMEKYIYNIKKIIFFTTT